MKIAVTGSTGHIGNNMVRGLIDNGFETLALYRSPQKSWVLDGLDCEKIQADVLDEVLLQRTVQEVDVVVHLAGVISINGDPDGRVMKVNVEGTRNVVNACLQAGVKKLIHFSSNHALKYDENTPIVNEDTPLADATCIKYDYSKALGEMEVLEGVQKGLDACILNPTSVLGPHDYFDSLQGNFLLDLFNGKMPALVKGGFDWMDVRDAVNAGIAAIEKGITGARYLIGGRWADASELASICEAVSGRNAPSLVLPIWVAMLGLPFVHLESKLTGKPLKYTYEGLKILKHANKNFSFEKARKELGYEARDLEETIRDAYEWYNFVGKIKPR